MAAKVKVDDVGTVIRLNTRVDLTETALVRIVARDPKGTIVHLDADVADITWIQHIKTADTLNKPGKWTLQSYAEWATGEKIYGDETSLRVWDTLESAAG